MRKRIAVVAGTLATLAAPQVAAAAEPADTVLRNGRVYTADARDSIAQAVALRDGRIAYVGSDRGVRRFVGPRTEVVDLRGRMAMPGLIDGHAHPLAGGDILDDCDLGNADATIAELQEVIRACDAADPASDAKDWLQVSNWSPVGILPAGTVVSRTDLDAISTTRPIFVSGSDGHNAWVNSRALELAGVTKDTPDPADGEIVRDPDGTPRGLLKDGAIGLVSRAIPAKTKADDLRDARRAQRALNAAGITTVMDAAAGRKDLRTWSALAKRGGMDVRMSSFVALESSQSQQAAWRYANGLRKRFTAPGLTIHGVKLFLDGVIEAPAQTAALLEPYLVERDGAWVPGDSRGSLYFTPKQIAALSAKFDAKRWRIHMHAIGDWAVRAGLDGAEAARKANGSPASRRNFAITHLQLVDPADYPRFRELGVFANMQLQWANRSTWTEEALASFIGPERHRLLYPARSLVDAGAPFSQGSDWPVDPLNPWLELETAQTRTFAPRGPLYPEQSIPIKTALRAHTIGSARQLGLQRTTGSLERGKSADVIVLDRDVLRVAPAKVGETEVLRTWLRGRTVYRKR